LHSNKQFEKFVGKFQTSVYQIEAEKNKRNFGSSNLILKITEVIFVKDMLYAVLALISALTAAGSFYYFQHSDGNTLLLVVAVICVILAMIFGILFLAGRVNKTEDIHITE